MISLTPNGNACVDITGVDGLNNTAPIAPLSIDIDNHAMAYATLITPTRIQIVSRGPLGTFNLLVNSKDISSKAIPTLIIPCQTITGFATQLIAVPTVATLTFGITDLPVGW